MQRQILIARHGQTYGDIANVIEGWTDFELDGRKGLTDLGKLQAHALGKALEDEDIDIIVSGTLLRQRQTTNIVNQYLKRDIYFTDMLRERSAGIHDGHPYKNISVDDPKIAEQWYKGFIPGSNQETLSQILDKTRTLHDNMSHMIEPHEKNILLVGSSWINSYLLNTFLDENNSGKDYFVLRPQENASFHRLTLDYRFRLIDHELNILPEATFPLDISKQKDLKPSKPQDNYGAQRKTG